MVSGTVPATKETTTSFSLTQSLTSDRMLAARAVEVEMNFTLPGGRGNAAFEAARVALARELDGCDFTATLQAFIDSHRGQINYVTVNGRQMDAGWALYTLNEYIETQMEAGTYRVYPMPSTPMATEAGQQEEARPHVVQPTRIEPGTQPAVRSPLDFMQREQQAEQEGRTQEQEERARTQVEQPEEAQPEVAEPPPQMQEQEGVLLTQAEAAAVEAVPEAVQEQAAEQVRENVQAINAAVPVMPSTLDGVIRTSYHATVMDMWAELNRLCGQSAIIADKLKYVTEQYYSALERLEDARGTPGENALKNKVRELEGQMKELQRQLDPLLSRQGQLMTDILAYMPDAFAEAQADTSSDREELVAGLAAIRDDWKSNQEKILAALSIREISGDLSSDRAFLSALAAARRGSIENIYDVFARMVQNEPQIGTQLVDWVALGNAVQASYATIRVGPVGTAAPILGETAGGAFEFRSRRGTFRIEIAGEDLSGMTFAEMKRRVMELVNDPSISNQQLLGMLTVQQLRTGEEPYRFRSRYLLRTTFFQDYASGNIRVLETAPLSATAIPTGTYEAAHAPPAVGERQLPVPPVATRPAEVAPTAPAVRPPERLTEEEARRLEASLWSQVPPPAAPVAPAVTQVPTAPITARPTAPVAAPETALVAETPEAPAPAPTAPVLEGATLAAFARRYGISTQDARDLNQFQRGQRGTLEVEVDTAENAQRVLTIVRVEANRRGVQAEYDIMPPQEAGGPYLVYYRTVGMLRAADNAAVESQNPYAYVGFAARLPMDYAFDYAAITARFGQAFAPYEARLLGFADAATVAQNPDAQLPAYLADTISGLASWVFHVGGERVSGLERAGQLIYARTPQQPVALAAGEGEALYLDQKEAAAFAAAFFTADAGRAYREIEGETLNVFEGNVRAALAGRDNAEVRDALRAEGALGGYATEAYKRLSQYYANPSLVEERISTFDAETRMSFEYAAEMLGEAMYRIRLAQTGEPENEDLRFACVNSARALLVVKIEGEGGRISFDKFTYEGREYSTGTNSLFTADGAEFGLEDGTVLSSHLLYVPQPEEGVVLLVGYMRGNERHMLADEGIQPFIYDLRQQGHLRDSLGLAGLTERWTWHLPLIDIRVPGEELLLGEDTPLFKAMDPLVMELHAKPTEVSLYIEGNFDLVPADYGAGADIDDAKFIMENVRLGGELVPADKVFSYEGVWFEFNNFRRAGQNRYFATAAPEVTSTYSGMFEEPGEIQNVAEFAADGNVYIYMRNGKIVDAERQADSEGAMRMRVGTYRFTLDSEGERIMPDASSMMILPEYRGLIFARIGREELEAKIAEERATVSEYRIEFDLNTQASSVAGERVIPYLYLHKGPIAPETEAGARADLQVAGLYDAEGYLVPRAQRIDAIDRRFADIRELRGTEITLEFWNSLKAEMSQLHEERLKLFSEMLEYTTGAMARINESGIRLDEESRGRLQAQEAALRANISGMDRVWSAWEAARDNLDRQLGL